VFGKTNTPSTRMTVETTGNFMLQDITNGAVIEAEGATEVEKTGFITSQIEKGTLKESSAAPRKTDVAPETEAEKAAEPAPVTQPVSSNKGRRG
jgi:hypothetical protein